MKLNYSEFCYSDRVTIDGNKVEPFTEEHIGLLTSAVAKLATKYGTADVFKQLILDYGEYEETTQCEQCGDWDTIVNLEI